MGYMKAAPKNMTVAALSAILVSLCWGGNFTAGKFALSQFPAVEATFIRFVIVCVLLAPFAIRSKRMNLKEAFNLSLLYIIFHFVPMFYAMGHGLSVSSTIIVSQMGVPFSCIMAAIFFRDYLGPWRSMGLLTAFIGLILIAGTPNVVSAWPAFLIALCGALSWAGANNYMKTMKSTGIISMLFWPSLLALPQLALISLLTFKGDYATILTTAPLSAWVGVSYNAIASTIIGYGLWMWLLQHCEISKIVPYSLTMPIFGLLIAQIFFPEPLAFEHYAGMALTISGVAVITIRRPRLAEIEKI